MAAPTFPSSAHPFAGIFSAAIAATLHELGHDVVVLSPRPYAPPGITRFRRWQHYGGIDPFSTYRDVPVHRPNTIVVPGLWQAFWSDSAAWFASKRYVAKLHRQSPFHLVLGLDLGGAGGLAWRLGRTLRVRAAGWAYGSEVRTSGATDHGRSVRGAIEHLDVVFYQSTELRECAGRLVGRDLSGEPDAAQHRVLPHGIRLGDTDDPRQSGEQHLAAGATPTPIGLCERWGIAPGHRVVLSLGRLLRTKGVFDLLNAFEALSREHADLVLVMIGALPPRDDTEEFRRSVSARGLDQRVLVFPPIDPTMVQYALRSADVFAFTSYLEGMPNVVLEALLAKTPIVAFDIPPLREADPMSTALTLVPKGDAEALGVEILRALDDSEERSRRIEAGAAIVHTNFDMRRNLQQALGIIDNLGSR